MKTLSLDIPDSPRKFYAVVPPHHPFAHFTREECERYFGHDIEVLVQGMIPRESKS
jgi:hypothetical protein